MEEIDDLKSKYNKLLELVELLCCKRLTIESALLDKNLTGSIQRLRDLADFVEMRDKERICSKEQEEAFIALTKQAWKERSLAWNKKSKLHKVIYEAAFGKIEEENKNKV